MESDSGSRWEPPGVEWGHGVNSMAELSETLADGVHFIEADVLLSANTGQPVMAHPPATHSDLSLKDFLRICAEHNERDPKNAVAIKLDFKDPDAVEPSLDLVNRSPFWGRSERDPPVWLNADVLPGPGHRPPLFDAETFIRQCLNRRPKDTLSLGWTVHHTGIDVVREGYHDAHIDEMIALCQKHSVSNVTFAVHSLFAQQAAHRMLRLLHACPQSTMTFWGLADSQVHRWLDSLDEQRTYRDTLPPGWGEWVSLVLARALGYLT